MVSTSKTYVYKESLSLKSFNHSLRFEPGHLDNDRFNEYRVFCIFLSKLKGTIEKKEM